MDFQSISPKHTIVFEPAKEYIVHADKIRIKQVITNLLSNAIKYSPEDSKVYVQLQENTNKTFLSVCIKDQGIGISAEDEKTLFDKFARASNSRRKNIPGIGLGLHISSEIIKQHECELSFTSTENKGSTFCFTLPIV